MFTILRNTLTMRPHINQRIQTRPQRLFGFLLLIVFTGLLSACRPGDCRDFKIVGYFPWRFAIECAPEDDPFMGKDALDSDLNTYREMASLTLLGNGQVLIAGGSNGNALASAELYDPDTKTWSVTGSLSTARDSHTATLLPNGQVLVVGGSNGGSLASAELYDPISKTWSTTGSLTTARDTHTATLLSNGKVLVVGGNNGAALASAELYDPAAGTWSPTGSMGAAREEHAATRLGNDQVLVSGGSELASAELYDPAVGTWSLTGSMGTARSDHSATMLKNGEVLVSGGSELASAELYDPAVGLWSATGSMNSEHSGHTTTLLLDGFVLAAGGRPLEDLNCIECADHPLATRTELYDPSTGEWSNESRLAIVEHSAVLLPTGAVLVTGGEGALLFTLRSGAWDSSLATGGVTAALNPNGLNQVSGMGTPRQFHSATLLPGGKLLVAGGSKQDDSPQASAELYDLTTKTWNGTGAMGEARQSHSETLLPNDKVLVVGGRQGANIIASAELYDPATGKFTPTGSMSDPRSGHQATLLTNGKVLISGGNNGLGTYLATAELYDPGTGMWTSTGSMNVGRYLHSATLLHDGRVLAAAGNGRDGTGFIYLDSAEVYNPATGLWTSTGSLDAARESHSATLLDDGHVLVAGGSAPAVLDRSELYDPQAGTWKSTGSLNEGRGGHTATALPNGLVLAVGGASNSDFLKTAELYHPETKKWESTNSLQEPGRLGHTATLLTNYQVMVAGGQSLTVPLLLDNVEIYNTDMHEYHLANGDLLTQTPRYGARYKGFGGEVGGIILSDHNLWMASADLVTSWAPVWKVASGLTLKPNSLNRINETTITQVQLDKLKGFIDTIYDKGSPELQQAITEEGELLPPYEFFVGKTVSEGRQVLFESGNKSYTITPTAGTGGSITPDTAQEALAYMPITFEITADSGYKIKDVLVDGVSQGAIRSYTFEKVNADHTISAEFDKGDYIVNLPAVMATTK